MDKINLHLIMQRELISRYYNKIFLGIICLLGAYIVTRAYYVDITDDEAWAFYNVKHFWYVESLCTGNTHWFNFAAIKAALLLGFEKVWQIRWFSVISALIFFYVIYLWIKTFQSFLLKLVAFSFALLHPYLLEYLSLARGYSSGLCFMALSILLLVKADKYTVIKFNLPALLFAGCSAISNFNFFYFFIAFCLIYFCEHYFKNGFSFLKDKRFYIDSLFSIVIVLLVLRALLFIKECSNDIADFGGNTLVDSVFGSYLKLFNPDFHLQVGIMNLLAYTVFGIVLFVSSVGAFNLRLHNNKLYFYVSCILLLMLGLTVFNKWCFGVLYPTDRTALLFYPLIALVIVEFARTTLNKHIAGNVILFIVTMTLICNSLSKLSLTGGRDHPYCEGSKACFEYLDSINAKKVGIPLDLYCVYSKYYKVSGTNFQAESINTFGRDVRWINKNKLDDFEYILLLPPYNLSYYKNEKIRFEGIRFFSENRGLILKISKMATGFE